MNTPNRVIALGFFDGVHNGHGALLRRVAEKTAELEAANRELEDPKYFTMYV